MTTRKTLKKQNIKLLNSLNAEQLKTALDMLQFISTDNKIRVHLPQTPIDSINTFYTNAPDSLLTVTMNDEHIGPKYIPHDTCFKRHVDKIIDNYILNHAQQYIPSDDYVLKSSKEVSFRCGDKVMYMDYIFLLVI